MTFTKGDVVGVALDMNYKRLKFYINGASMEVGAILILVCSISSCFKTIRHGLCENTDLFFFLF